MLESCYFVYILKCSDNTLYTGITNNIEKRLATHKSGKGAKYVSGRLPIQLVYQEGPFSLKGDALRREIAIKKLSRHQKEQLINR